MINIFTEKSHLEDTTYVTLNDNIRVDIKDSISGIKNYRVQQNQKAIDTDNHAQISKAAWSIQKSGKSRGSLQETVVLLGQIYWLTPLHRAFASKPSTVFLVDQMGSCCSHLNLRYIQKTMNLAWKELYIALMISVRTLKR